MNVYVPTSVTQPSAPRRIRARQSPVKRVLLWLSGVFAGATVLVTVGLIAAKLVTHDAVALEMRASEPDPFYQQKLDAREQELPAQF